MLSIQIKQISIVGFYSLPYPYLSHIFKNMEAFTIAERSFFIDHKYSYKLLKNIINYEEILPHIISHDTEKLDTIPHKSIYSYLFDEDMDKGRLKDALSKNFQDYKDIITTFELNEEEVFKSIYTIKDFHKLFSFYNVSYHSMDKETRDYIKGKIKENIQSYIKSYTSIAKIKPLIYRFVYI